MTTPYDHAIRKSWTRSKKELTRIMKNVFLTCIGLAGFFASFSQQGHNTKTGQYNIVAQYNHEFVLGGFVRLREWELEGDKMNLKDLGMTGYAAILHEDQASLAFFIALSFIVDGLAIIRIYARVFLGPHVKSMYEMGYRSS